MDTVSVINKDVDNRIKNNNYDTRLYHYTSAAKLYSILKNKEIWFGNTANMNDKKEVKYFVELLQEALGKNIPSNKLTQCDNFFQKVYTRIDSEYPYAMSFSRLDDDAAQWERYADNAEGICIIFDTKNIMCALYDPYLIFGNVYYDFDIRKHPHYKILYDYFIAGKLNGFDDDETGQIDNMIGCSYCCKHRSFRSEQEIRAVNLWNHIPKHARAETECVQGIIKKFLKFDMEKRCAEVGLAFEDLFEGIVIGPKSAQDIHSLQLFIEESGFASLKGKISKSNCPLR